MPGENQIQVVVISGKNREKNIKKIYVALALLATLFLIVVVGTVVAVVTSETNQNLANEKIPTSNSSKYRVRHEVGVKNITNSHFKRLFETISNHLSG